MIINLKWFEVIILVRKKRIDMNDRYLKVLIELESRGIDMEANISDFMYKIFANQPDLTYDKNIAIESTPEEYITRIVNTMGGNKHLKISSKPKPTGANPNRLLVEGRITYLGLEYLNQYRLNKSNSELNTSLKKSVKYQIGIGFITMIAIGFTAYYDRQNLKKPEPVILKRLDTLLQKQAQQLDSLTKSQKERNIYLKTTAGKISTKKKHYYYFP